MTCCKDLIEKLEYTCIRGSVDVEVSSVEMDSLHFLNFSHKIFIWGTQFHHISRL